MEDKRKATGAHFNQQGHSFSDMTVTVLEKIFNKNPQYRKTREKMWINRLNTKVSTKSVVAEIANCNHFF